MVKKNPTPKSATIKEQCASAKARGDLTFDPGAPCAYGHISPRWTNSAICVECKRASDRAYRTAHKKDIAAYQAAYCRKNADRIRASHTAYRAANREKYNATLRAYRARSADRVKTWSRGDPEKRKESRRVYRAANHEKLLEAGAKRRRELPERVALSSHHWYTRNATRLRAEAADRLAANPEPSRGYKRRWKQRNKGKVRADGSKRRAIKLGARTGCRKAYTAYVEWARTEPFIPCTWCRKRTKPGNRHLDHIIPLAKGGADAVENLCIACPGCNARKHAKLPEHFAKSGQSELRFG